MRGLAAHIRRLRPPAALRVGSLLLALTASLGIQAQQAQQAEQAEPAQASEPTPASSLDAPLFYQLLIGEIELNAGRPGNAFEVMLDAAKRQGDDSLFQRAVDIALQARAGEQALTAARAWRDARPRTVAPVRYETQILLALGKTDGLAVPLAAWLEAVPTMQRPGLIASLPRLLQRMSDKQQLLALTEQLVAPYRDRDDTRQASMLAVGRARLAAGDADGALDLSRQALTRDAKATGAVLLAIEMLPGSAAAEPLVTRYLDRPDADVGLRLTYVRVLTQSQRYADASAQLTTLTRQQPQLAPPWLTLGALRIELRQPREAEQALQRYLELAGTNGSAAAATDDDDDENQAEAAATGAVRNPGQTAETLEAGRTQAWLLLAQAAEQRGDLPTAEQWLARIDNPQRALEVQSRRASIMARQGRLAEGRALIRAVPERNGADARGKTMAEVQLLREAKLWGAAAELLAGASSRSPDDADLVYELAMIEDKLERHDEMERLLRQVIALKPDHAHAHNALGYSLADRNQRLPEARQLVQRALELSPGDPFITDSLGWIEYRLGNHVEAVRLLKLAYAARPDTEIAAHLGEVLWATNQQAEARKIWSEARVRDDKNEVLRETLARLKVGL